MLHFSLIIAKNYIIFKHSGPPQERKILINEILFNPKQGGVEFIELYNYSNHVIDLEQLFLSRINNQGQRSDPIRISQSSLLFYPGSYCVLTTDPHALATQYPRGNQKTFVLVHKLPNFNNEQGRVLILHQNDPKISDIQKWALLDSLHYYSSMHSQFLKNVKGVSLERKSWQLPTNTTGNFRSAALHIGGATPGMLNSTSYQDQQFIQFKSKILSPDHDNYEDHLEVAYNIPVDNLMATLLIYNQAGRITKKILRNTSIPSEGRWYWDGKTDQGNIADPGIYTLFIDLYNDEGYRLINRKSFVLMLRN